MVYQGRTGSPDDWCFFPGGVLVIVECKTTGEKPKKHQAKEIKRLRESGFSVFVVDSKEGVDEIMRQTVPTPHD